MMVELSCASVARRQSIVMVFAAILRHGISRSLAAARRATTADARLFADNKCHRQYFWAPGYSSLSLWRERAIFLIY